jgi:hypothetical protein
VVACNSTKKACNSYLNETWGCKCFDSNSSTLICNDILNNYTIARGYNQIRLNQSLEVDTDQLFELNPYNASIALYELLDSQKEYCDMHACSTESENLIKNKKLFLRALYVPNELRISKMFSTPGRHKITVTTEDNSMSTFEYINVESSKRFIFVDIANGQHFCFCFFFFCLNSLYFSIN